MSFIFFFLLSIMPVNNFCSQMWDLGILHLKTDRSTVTNLQAVLNRVYDYDNDQVTVDTIRDPLCNLKETLNTICKEKNIISSAHNLYGLAINNTLKRRENFPNAVQELKKNYLDELKNKCELFLDKPLQKKFSWNFDNAQEKDNYKESIQELKKTLKTFYNQTNENNYENASKHLNAIKDSLRTLEISHTANHITFLTLLGSSKNNFNTIRLLKTNYLDSLKTDLESLEIKDSESDSDTEYFSDEDQSSDDNNPIQTITADQREIKTVNQPTPPQPPIQNSPENASIDFHGTDHQINKHVETTVNTNNQEKISESTQSNLEIAKKARPQIIETVTKEQHKEENNPKTPRSTEPKKSWSRLPFIFVGIALFSITAYLILKNYYFGKIPA